LDLPGLAEKFKAAGGRFVTPVEELTRRLEQCQAIVFDWDGVFNAGRKGHAATSGFAEADSMGTNMLRYGLWRKLGRLPFAAIISGENNASAIAFAEREHFDAAYTGMRDKRQVIEHICDQHELRSEQIACVFDDINDLPMAEICGLRFRVRRDASPLFAAMADDSGFCDYVTGANADRYAVREVCELMLGLMDAYTDVVDSRVAYDTSYQDYFKTRQSVTTCLYGQDGEVIVLHNATVP
jgi:3-deoxy-D-manno-octulosonate 8-phosphate phosphatase (KDO 8-P phosphatase)